jgi:hypothetical protein
MRKCWIILFATVLGYDTFSGKLICWVPAVLIPLAQIGIDANPVDCIRWAGMEDIRRLDELPVKPPDFGKFTFAMFPRGHVPL